MNNCFSCHHLLTDDVDLVTARLAPSTEIEVYCTYPAQIRDRNTTNWPNIVSGHWLGEFCHDYQELSTESQVP